MNNNKLDSNILIVITAKVASTYLSFDHQIDQYRAYSRYRYILEHTKDPNGALEQPVSALQLGSSPVESTLPEASAFEVLKKLDASRISGVAVCNTNGRMVGNFSISEMRQDPNESPQVSYLFFYVII